MQVAVVDLNKTCGEECKAQLDAQFGEGKCIFISCDVTNGDALRGNAKDIVQLYSSMNDSATCASPARETYVA